MREGTHWMQAMFQSGTSWDGLSECVSKWRTSIAVSRRVSNLLCKQTPSCVRVRPVDLHRRVNVDAPVEQEPGDNEVVVPRRGDEAGSPILYGQAMRKGTGG